MPPDVLSPRPYDLANWLAQHRIVALCVVAFCLWVSSCLILRMWFIHRRGAFRKKLIWSVILLLPLLGWLFYGAFFTMPDVSDTPCPTEHSSF